MGIEKFDGEVKNYWGKPLTELARKDGSKNTIAVLPFAGTFNSYGPTDKSVENYTDADFDAAYAEMKEKNEIPSLKEIVQLGNNKRKAAARQKAMLAVVNAAELVQPTLENDSQLRLKKMYDIFIANGDSHEVARESAAAALRLTWAD